MGGGVRVRLGGRLDGRLGGRFGGRRGCIGSRSVEGAQKADEEEDDEEEGGEGEWPNGEAHTVLYWREYAK